MTITDKNAQAQNAQSKAQAQGRQAPGYDAQQAAPRGGSKAVFSGISTLNEFMQRPLSRNSVGEQTMAIAETFRNYLREESLESVFEVIPVERSTYDLNLSLIVIAASYKTSQGPELFAYTFVIEPTDGVLDPRQVREGNIDIEIPSVASDAYDDRATSAVITVVRNRFNMEAPVEDVGYSVISNLVDVKDVPRLQRILTNAVNAIDGIAKEMPGNLESRFCTNMFRGSDYVVTGRMEFNSTPVETLNGSPVRNDVSILTRVVKRGGDNAQTQSRVLTQVGGYLDISFVNPEPRPNQFNQLVMPTNRYQARFIITNTAAETTAITPELVLFGIASSRMLANNGAWVNGFKPQHGIKGTNTRDIGAVGYEIDLSNDGSGKFGLIDTNDDTFNLNQVIQRSFMENLVYSIDIEDGGDTSWLYLALQLSNTNEDAYNAVYNAANNLTDGNFGKIFRHGTPFVQYSGNTIHLGHYTTENGQREDLRRLDYLAMLNIFGKDDMRTVIEYSDTFETNRGSVVRRLADRTRLIQGCLHNSAVIKGYAQRYDINGEFIDALATGISQTGMTIQPETTFADFNQNVRGNPNLSAMAVSSGPSTLFTTPNAGNFGNNTWNNPRGGRFG